jgi:hypothetical protein
MPASADASIVSTIDEDGAGDDAAAGTAAEGEDGTAAVAAALLVAATDGASVRSPCAVRRAAVMVPGDLRRREARSTQ